MASKKNINTPKRRGKGLAPTEDQLMAAADLRELKEASGAYVRSAKQLAAPAKAQETKNSKKEKEEKRLSRQRKGFDRANEEGISVEEALAKLEAEGLSAIDDDNGQVKPDSQTSIDEDGNIVKGISKPRGLNPALSVERIIESRRAGDLNAQALEDEPVAGQTQYARLESDLSELGAGLDSPGTGSQISRSTDTGEGRLPQQGTRSLPFQLGSTSHRRTDAELRRDPPPSTLAEEQARQSAFLGTTERVNPATGKVEEKREKVSAGTADWDMTPRQNALGVRAVSATSDTGLKKEAALRKTIGDIEGMISSGQAVTGIGGPTGNPRETASVETFGQRQVRKTRRSQTGELTQTDETDTMPNVSMINVKPNTSIEDPLTPGYVNPAFRTLLNKNQMGGTLYGSRKGGSNIQTGPNTTRRIGDESMGGVVGALGYTTFKDPVTGKQVSRRTKDVDRQAVETRPVLDAEGNSTGETELKNPLFGKGTTKTGKPKQVNTRPDADPTTVDESGSTVPNPLYKPQTTEGADIEEMFGEQKANIARLILGEKLAKNPDMRSLAGLPLPRAWRRTDSAAMANFPLTDNPEQRLGIGPQFAGVKVPAPTPIYGTDGKLIKVDSTDRDSVARVYDTAKGGPGINDAIKKYGTKDITENRIIPELMETSATRPQEEGKNILKDARKPQQTLSGTSVPAVVGGKEVRVSGKGVPTFAEAMDLIVPKSIEQVDAKVTSRRVRQGENGALQIGEGTTPVVAPAGGMADSPMVPIQTSRVVDYKNPPTGVTNPIDRAKDYLISKGRAANKTEALQKIGSFLTNTRRGRSNVRYGDTPAQIAEGLPARPTGVKTVFDPNLPAPEAVKQNLTVRQAAQQAKAAAKSAEMESRRSAALRESATSPAPAPSTWAVMSGDVAAQIPRTPERLEAVAKLDTIKSTNQAAVSLARQQGGTGAVTNMPKPLGARTNPFVLPPSERPTYSKAERDQMAQQVEQRRAAADVARSQRDIQADASDASLASRISPFAPKQPKSPAMGGSQFNQ
ncbi:hypothetical protein UFOVP629_46 [uncultured Caudovirales phage]|uniref:Uncharacterized protein n=1 Tax=uncultured Caudovirales phage TaxID=2100421 RepID=A0A6J5N7A5_9CAUD|nr:hypothetical protein UFOVP629_46 [uncultured Caudovirales phage]